MVHSFQQDQGSRAIGGNNEGRCHEVWESPACRGWLNHPATLWLGLQVSFRNMTILLLWVVAEKCVSYCVAFRSAVRFTSCENTFPTDDVGYTP